MRIALISDIHEDLKMLEKALDQIGRQKVDMIVCLGDITGYSSTYYSYEAERNASACVRLIRSNCEIVIPGNHDLSNCRRLPEHSDVFDYPENWYDLEPDERLAIAGDLLWMHEDDLDTGLSRDELNFLSGLPEFASAEADGKRIFFSHYIYPNLSGMRQGFYTRKNEFTDHLNMMKEKDCQIGFTGHAHPEGIYRVSERRYQQYPYNKWLKMKNLPAIFGLPPINRNGGRSAFTLVDLSSMVLSAIKMN